MAKSIKKSKKKETRSRGIKEERLFQNLLRVASQFMGGRGYHALSQMELMERLSLPPQHGELFQEVLEELVSDGIAELTGGRYRMRKSQEEVVSGVLRVHPRGFGFLQPHDPGRYPEDIFIPKHLTQNAVDGDIVEVVINPESFSEKGPEGKVITILERSRTHLAGIISEVESYGDIVAYVPILGVSQRVVVHPTTEMQLKVGDRIVMEVKEWGSKESETVCHFSHYIGHISDPACDIKAAIEEYELRADFPKKVLDEAKKIGNRISLKDLVGREDLRKQECFTIDPDTAKDYDDAVSLSKDAQGHYHLGVHIADVSHYVSSGSALDEEARQRCNSTYFPGYCLPMLPRELSNELCSLKPKVNRLTISVFVRFDSHGNQIDYRIARSVIKSVKRFTYKEAKVVLDGKKKSKFAPTLELMVELCGLLKKKRYERGSLEFALPELVVKVDEKGVPQQTEHITYDITHQLIEEFMLKANEIVALHLSQLGKNLTYRVHDIPAEENMKDFSVLAGAFGFKLSDKPTPSELQALFDEALTTPYGEYLATSYIRRMRLALYSPDNIGHYGLGLTHYCHFTSPIRRYVDLVVHRILFGESDERETLELIADQCSEQERISAKAENNVVLLKKLRLLQAIHEKNPRKEYEAVVTRVKNFGVYFEVLDFMLESFLHVSELENDFFVFDEAKVILKGRHYGQTYCAGDRFTVILKDVNLILLESKWNLVAERRSQKRSSKGAHPPKSFDRAPLPSRNIKNFIGKKTAKSKPKKLKKARRKSKRK